MAFDSSGRWHPNISAKQGSLIWAISPENPAKKKFMLVCGPRRSGKTIGITHAIASHLWNTESARVTMIAPTMGAAADGGPWQLLVEHTIPEWIEGNFGFEWVEEPYTEGTSKRLKAEVRNKFGGKSTIQLDSLREGDKESEVARRFKGRSFSMVYISEMADWIKSRRTFDVLTECLRMPHLNSASHVMLLDTNPAEEGIRHWAYNLFYEFRTANNDIVPELLRPLRDELSLTEFTISDNTFLTPEDVNLLKSTYAHSPELYDRYILGKWTFATCDGLFYDVFRPKIHIVGDLETPVNKEPEMLIPEEDCFELFTGWDPGTTNYAAVILERFYQKGANGKEEPVFKVLDELIHLGSDLTMGEFTEQFVEKMDWWEKYCDKKFKWTHFSDRSAFDMRESISDRYQHQEVYVASGGRITLNAVEKGDGTVRQRIDILRKLMFQNRIFISNPNCDILIRSLQGLRGDKMRAISKESTHKHAFDALTYALSSLCFEEMQARVRLQTSKESPTSSKCVSVSL